MQLKKKLNFTELNFIQHSTEIKFRKRFFLGIKKFFLSLKKKFNFNAGKN